MLHRYYKEKHPHCVYNSTENLSHLLFPDDEAKSYETNPNKILVGIIVSVA